MYVVSGKTHTEVSTIITFYLFVVSKLSKINMENKREDNESYLKQ